MLRFAKKIVDRRASSTFASDEIAEQAVASALRAHESSLQNWLSNSSHQKFAIEMKLDQVIGEVKTAGQHHAVPSHTVRVILQRNEQDPQSYSVSGSYPI